MNKISLEKEEHIIATLQRDINLAIAFLLITGQLTIRGVFVTSGGFSITLTGPIVGGHRTEGKPGFPIANTIIDIIDIVIFLLLIIGKISIIGVLVGPGRLTFTVSGPIFGEPFPEPSLPIVRESLQYYRQMISTHFDLDPRLFSKLEKE